MPLFSPQTSPDQAAPPSPPQTPDPSLSDPSLASGGYSGTPTPQAPAAPAGLHPAVQDVAKHAIFGRAVKSLVHSIEGTRTVYQPNPQTGTIEETTVQNKPGQIFRNILLGSLIGGAAASERSSGAGGGGGFLGGFARGGTATIQDQRAQNLARQQQAQQQLKDQQERETLDDTENLHAVAVAHSNMQIASLQQNLHHADEATIDRRNTSARTYAKSLEDQGAKQANFMVNGKPVDSMSASEFAKAYTADPTLAKAVPGFQREFIDVTDATGLHFDGTYWRTDAGDLVNMSDKTQIRAFDVPTNTLKSFTQTPGTLINKLAGEQLVDPTKSYSINGEGRLALRTNGLKNDATAARATATKTRADQKDKLNKQVAQLISKRDATIAKANHNYYVAVNKDPLVEDNAKQELDKALKGAAKTYQDEIGALRGTPQAQNPQANPQAKTFSPTKWRAANPNGDVNAAINEAKRQGMTVGQ